MSKKIIKDYDSIVEKYLLIAMWIVASISFSIALFTGNWLRLSDLIGIFGIFLLTLVYFINKNATFYFMFAVLFIGMLNIATFEYYINLGLVFTKFGQNIQTGIQLYSTILMAIFIILRKPRIVEIFQIFFHGSEEDLAKEEISNKTYFKKKYEDISDSKLEELLNTEGFSTAAKDALLEIRKERTGFTNN